MKDNKDNIKKTVVIWILISLLFGILAYPLTFLIPINKKLWSSSYTFINIGITGISLCLIVWIVDIIGKNKPKYQKIKNRIIEPTMWFGRNALLNYIILTIYQGITRVFIVLDN